MPQPLRILRILFDRRILLKELPAFRGAIIEKVGMDKEWFHNHNNAKPGGTLHYRYSLVQYKLFKGYPAVIFIGTGIDEAQHFFAQSDWKISFTKQNYLARVSEMKVFEYPIGLTKEMQTYRLKNYVPFNTENYQRYQHTPGLVKRTQIIEGLMARHIIVFLEGINQSLEDRFDLEICQLEEKGRHTVSRTGMELFDVTFQTNLALPLMIGLGRAVSQGFGVLHPWSLERPRQQERIYQE